MTIEINPDQNNPDVLRVDGAQQPRDAQDPRNLLHEAAKERQAAIERQAAEQRDKDQLNAQDHKRAQLQAQQWERDQEYRRLAAAAEQRAELLERRNMIRKAKYAAGGLVGGVIVYMVGRWFIGDGGER